MPPAFSLIMFHKLSPIKIPNLDMINSEKRKDHVLIPLNNRNLIKKNKYSPIRFGLSKTGEKNMKRTAFVTTPLFLILFLYGCATGHQETARLMRQNVAVGTPELAVPILEKSALAEDKDSKLLFLVEHGMLEHYQGNYAASTKWLDEAKVMLGELFTTRVSGKIQSVLSNDNADLYYGEKYEASLVYFYSSLNHYMQAEIETDANKKRESLVKARAEILAWDSFLTDMKSERLGQALFKEDLLAKTFGALVHESQNTNQDSQIALQLYQDANEVLFKNYNAYPSFNNSYATFRENYSKFPNITKEEVERDYVQVTEHSGPLKQFLATKILLLTKKLKPNEYQEQVAKLNPSAEVLKQVETKGGNVTFLVQDGLIAEKTAKVYHFPIDLGSMLSFANSTLGVVFNQGISYELPHVPNVPKLETAKLQALDPMGNVMGESSLSVIAPIGEMAEQAINEHAAAVAASTGARLVTKHIAAIGAAYATYQSMSQNSDLSAFAGMSASLAYAGSVAAINASEKADTRFWSTLPSNVRMGSMTLPKGTYKFQAVFGDVGQPNYRVIGLGEKVVESGMTKFVSNNKIPVPAVERNIATESVQTSKNIK